jgi:hypothetical protein
MDYSRAAPLFERRAVCENGDLNELSRPFRVTVAGWPASDLNLLFRTDLIAKEHSMSIFGNIMSAIFHHANAAPAATAPSASGAPSAPGAAPSAAPASSASSSAPSAPVDVEAVLTKLAAQNKEKLDWRHSIVDLMKLLNLDSSLAARKELAGELHYTGDTNDSATMNIWLHAQVMHKLADNGGKVPADLLKH